MALFEVQARGVRVAVTGFYARETYASLREGYPHEAVNQALARYARQRAAQVFPGVPVWAVEPEAVPRRVQGPLPLGPWVELPRLLCVARCDAPDAVGVPDVVHAEVVLVWFQDAWPPPPSPRAIEVLAGLPWASGARVVRVGDA